MTLRVTVNSVQAGQRFKADMRRAASSIDAAIAATAKETADAILKAGRADIQNAGKFGTRWTSGLQAKVGRGGGFTRITITHNVPYWTVFERGKVIRGKPMLWIPLSFALDAQRVWARNYPGRLVRVERPGKAPLLVNPLSGPKYFGKRSVTIPKKFHLTQIAAREARRMSSVYSRNFRRLNRGR